MSAQALPAGVSEEDVVQFAAISGLPHDQCVMYLEMAGGSLEGAVSIFFENADGGGLSGNTGTHVWCGLLGVWRT